MRNKEQKIGGAGVRMDWKRLLGWLFLIGGLLLAGIVVWRMARGEPSGTPRAAPRRGLNVLLVTLDTTRADHLGCYGGEEGVTPTLDGLASNGVMFESVLSPAPLTLPSHTSMLTGLYPNHHGVRNNGMFVLPEKTETLAEVFHRAGYHTGAFVSAAVLSRKYGLSKGFDVYDDDLSRGFHLGHSTVPSRTGDVTLEAATAWIRSLGEKDRFFCWLHLYDAHYPYLPPPEFRKRFPSDPYTAEIAFADSIVGRFLQVLKERGVLDSTVVAVAADHGEALDEHGEKTHGVLLHQATLHVPWLLVGPTIPKGVRVKRPVSLVDVAPTLARLSRLRPPNVKRLDGMALLVGRSQANEENRKLYAETLLPYYQYGWSPLRALRQGPWELILGVRPALYNLDRDPRELTDLADRNTAMVNELARALKTMEAHSADEKAAEISLSQSEIAQLQSLGYLGVGGVPPRKEAPDPRDLVGAHVHMERGRELAAAGRPEDAVRELNALLEEDPGNVSALTTRAAQLLRLGRTDEARADLDRALAIDSDNATVYAQLARLERDRGNLDTALKLARMGSGKRGAFETLWVLQASILGAQGRIKEARALIEKRLRIKPDDPELLTARAAMERRAGELEAAERDLRRAVSVDALCRPARRALVSLLTATHRDAEAVTILEDLLRIEPGNGEAMALLGRLKLKDPEAARTYLEEAVRLSPNLPEPMISLGVCYVRLGRLHKAEAILRRALTKNPGDPHATNALAVVMIMTDRLDEAEKLLRGLIASGHDGPEVRNNLANLYGCRGELGRAEREARRALALHSGFLDAELTLSNTLQAQEKFHQEVKVLEAAMAQHPEDRRIPAHLGVALAGADRCPEAMHYLGPALKEASENLDLLAAAARCEEKLGRVDAATGYYERLARAAPKGALRDEALSALERLALKGSVP